jgi:hypothetical protein
MALPCEVPARSESLGGSGWQLNFQIERYKSALARISWSRRCFPRFPPSVRRDKPRPVGSDTAGRGALLVEARKTPNRGHPATCANYLDLMPPRRS